MGGNSFASTISDLEAISEVLMMKSYLWLHIFFFLLYIKIINFCPSYGRTEFSHCTLLDVPMYPSFNNFLINKEKIDAHLSLMTRKCRLHGSALKMRKC